MSNNDIRWLQRLDSFNKAFKQLENAVELSKQRPLSKLEQQGIIQAFEFTHELAWKTVKDFLESRGNEDIFGSKDTTRLAFKTGLIQNGENWMNMIKARNMTSHTYNEETANEITDNVKNVYYNEFKKLQEKLKELKQKENE